MANFGPDEKLIRKLAQLLEESGLNEIEYEAAGERIRVSRGAALGVPAAAMAPTPPAAREEPPAASKGPPSGAVTAPMVGTVYVAPEPGAPPFVRVGDTVREGQPLLIIEAMKVMNQIPSPRAGRVSEILVHDGQPVEYGEPLLVIE